MEINLLRFVRVEVMILHENFTTLLLIHLLDAKVWPRTRQMPTDPAKLTIFNTLGFIYKENGIKGLYRGVTPRIGLGIWQTICMVSFADYVKAWLVIGIATVSKHV